MSSVETYRALDYPLKIYGFCPGDLIAICLVFFTAHWLCDSLALDIAIIIPGLYLARKARKRPARYISGIYSYVRTPRASAVGLDRERIKP